MLSLSEWTSNQFSRSHPMPRFEKAPTGAPCWIDLLSSDPEKSRHFYSEIMGWTAEEPNPEFGGYFNFQKDGTRVAGCMGRQPGMEAIPDTWSVYLASDDARQTADAAVAHGGAVVVTPDSVGDLGVFAVVTDNSG